MRFLTKIFTIKKVPSVSWSSNFPLNTKPKFNTLIMLIIGLFLFGLGEAIIIGSGSGVSPWTVLAQGISSRTDLSIGIATFYISVAILIFLGTFEANPGNRNNTECHNNSISHRSYTALFTSPRCHCI